VPMLHKPIISKTAMVKPNIFFIGTLLCP